MATKIISMTYQLKRGTESAIETKNPILASGEPIIVFCPDNTTKLKVGDGTKPYKDLPFVGGTVSYDANGNITNIAIDSELSTESSNPVQNKVITKALDNKVDKVDGKGLSTNDFSDADKVKLDTLKAITVDDTLNINSFNTVTNNAITNAFNNMNHRIDHLILDGGEIV